MNTYCKFVAIITEVIAILMSAVLILNLDIATPRQIVLLTIMIFIEAFTSAFCFKEGWNL